MVRRKKQSPAARPPTTLQNVPDHLLELVIRRLDSYVPLLRAAAVCKRWHRVVSNVVYRVDLASNVLGHYHVLDPSYPARPGPPRRRLAFVPAPGSGVNARHFSLDFLPRGRRPWDLVDGCGSLLLLANRRRGGFFPDLVVCEPISRRFHRIRPMEDMKYHRCLGVFFMDSGSVGMTDFTVICVVYDRLQGMAEDVACPTACFYSERCREGWGWHKRDTVTSHEHIHGAESAVVYAGRSGGRICWSVDDDGTVLAARTCGGAFVRQRVPEQVRGPQHRRCSFRFVDHDGAEVVYPQVARLACVVVDELRVPVEVDRSYEWVLERRLCLPEATLGMPGRKESYFGRTARIVTAGDGYVVLTPAEETCLFSVELRTMRVEREHSRNRLAGAVFPYELQTAPDVEACVVTCERMGSGQCSHICVCT